MVLMGVIANLSSFNEKYMVRDELEATVQKVRNILMREDTCLEGMRGPGGAALSFDGVRLTAVQFVGVTNTAGSVTRIVESAQRPQYENNNDLKTARFTVEDMTLTEVNPGAGRSKETITEDPLVTPPVYDTFLVQLNIPTTLNGTALKTVSVPLKIFTDPARGNEIVKCYAVGTDSRSCGGFGGTIDATNAQCRMRACNADTITTLVSQGRGRACSGKPNCTPIGYYWVFQGAVAASATQSVPICVCMENCI